MWIITVQRKQEEHFTYQGSILLSGMDENNYHLSIHPFIFYNHLSCTPVSTLVITPTDNLERPVQLTHVCPWTVGGTWSTRRDPTQAQEEHAQNPLAVRWQC